jgi:putative nucleotidyltransferase with HDIG domain
MKDAFNLYMKKNLEMSRHVGASKLSEEKKIAFMKHTAEVFLEHIYSNDLRPEVFENARTVVDVVVSYLVQSHETFDLLSALNSHSEELFAHSLGVALYSVLIAQQLGWRSAPTLNKITLAGLFHDIGKKEIPHDILRKPRLSLSPEEIHLLESHPLRGAQLLASCSMIPSDIPAIVMQHHERDNGIGYPMRITKHRIHPLARLIAAADDFCDLVIAGPSRRAVSPAKALHQLKTCFDKCLDPLYITALEGVLCGGMERQTSTSAGDTPNP